MSLPSLAELATERMAQQAALADLERAMALERQVYAILSAALGVVPSVVATATTGVAGPAAGELAGVLAQYAVDEGRRRLERGPTP